MVAAIVNAMIAGHARDRTEEPACELIAPDAPGLCPDNSPQQARARWEACLKFRKMRPEGNA